MIKETMILGENAFFSTDPSETGLNNNVLVCGGSGCGKTMSVSEPRLLQTYKTSLIATVTKRRIVDKYAPLFKQRGYVVEELNFSDPGKSTVAFDPLQYVQSHADVTFLATSIVMANPKRSTGNIDPYWNDAAISLFSAEIAYVLQTEKEPTFADVLSLHSSLEFKEVCGNAETSLDSKFKKLAETNPNCFAISCWKSFNRLPIKTASCIFSTLNTTIDTIFSPELKDMIASKKKLDIEKVASRKTMLFISTSAVNTAMNCFINMFYAQIFKSLFEYAENQPDGKLPIPVHVLCDDFATGSRIQNFPEYISIFREKQISVTLLLQSESQLERMYGHDDAVTIINNCDSYLYMGGMDLKTCRSMSERINLPLDEVLYMPIGREFIFRRGQRPIITSRYNVLNNDLYKEITEAYEKSVNSKKLASQKALLGF